MGFQMSLTGIDVIMIILSIMMFLSISIVLIVSRLETGKWFRLSYNVVHKMKTDRWPWEVKE